MGVGYMSEPDYRDTLDGLVVAFCRDYFFRKEAIKESACTRRTLMEYEYINRRIAEAAHEIVGEEFEAYVKEIGYCVGYAGSDVYGISETTYKKLKKEVKVNIAKKLHLLD